MKVTTKDFQILKGEHEFEFPEGITVLQGKTGSGKSTVFYAIEDCLLNLSGLDDVINWGAKQASVTIENNNNKVTWIRTKTSSEYINENTQQNYVKASKLNSNDIADLGFYITKQNDVVNIQNEWKKLFPFDLKDTEMFRLFEDIFNISCSFTILDDYKKDEQEIKSQINKINDSINIYTQQCNNIDKVLDIINVSQVHEIIDKLEQKQLIVSDMEKDYKYLSEFEPLTQLNIPKQFDTINLTQVYNTLQDIITDLKAYENNLNIQQIELPTLLDFVFDDNLYDEISNDYTMYSSLNEQLIQYDNEINNLQDQYNSLMDKLKQIKVCPTCGQRMEFVNE